MAVNPAAVHFATLDTRRAYLTERIAAKRRIGWETQWDEAERNALTWALNQIIDGGTSTEAVAVFTDGVNRKLDAILTRLDTAEHQERKAMASVQDVQEKVKALQASVAKETDLTKSVITYVKGSNAMLADLKAQLEAAIAAGGNPAELQAVVEQLDAIKSLNDENADAIAAAMREGTTPPAEARPGFAS